MHAPATMTKQKHTMSRHPITKKSKAKPVEPTPKPKLGALRVWWIPQVPGEPFYQPVEYISEAKLLVTALGRYAAFQFEQRLKLDYSNSGGLECWDGSEWLEWEDDEGRTIDEHEP